MKKLLLFLFMLIVLMIFTGKDLSGFFNDDTNVLKVESIEDNKISGSTITLSSKNYSVSELLKKFYVVYSFHQDLEDIEIIYAYSPVLRGLEFVDKKPVNLMISVDKDLIYVSNPINLGSF